MEFRNNQRALTIGLLFLLTLMAASSCKQEISPRLKEIDRSINKDYKIGEQALDSMERLGLLEAKPNQMYSKLLRLKIADKDYRPIQNKKKEIDSLVNYFQGQKDGDALAQAYYLAGRVNSDLGDSPKALILYQKAEETVNKDNYALQGDIYCQMGYIYKECHLFHDAITTLKKAYIMDSLNNNKQNMLFDIRDIGTNYLHLQETNTAKLYFSKGFRESIHTNEFMAKTFAHQLAVIYLNQKDYSRAKEYLNISLNHIENYDNNKSGIYATAYKLYEATGEDELKNKYESWLLDNGTIWAKKSIYKDQLSKILVNDRNPHILDTWNKYNQYSDSVGKFSDIESIKRIEQLYNYKLKEKENKSLNSHNTVLSIIIICLTITLISIIGLSFMTYSNIKQKRKNLELKLDKYEALKRSSEQKNEQNIKDKNCAFKKSAIHQIIQNEIENGSYTLQDSYWKDLEKTVNEIYPNFTNNLNSFYEVSNHELKVCLMVKIGISPIHIAKFTNHSKEAINSTRGRLYAKVFKEPASAPKWDEFIKTL
mgnify:FL=1